MAAPTLINVNSYAEAATFSAVDSSEYQVTHLQVYGYNRTGLRLAKVLAMEGEMKAKPGGLPIRRALLVLGAGTVVLLLSAALFLTRPFTEPSWELASPHPHSIYVQGEIQPGAAADIPLVSPFHLQTDPMAGLLLINFEQDPDTVYHGFEPQFFDDVVHGRGLLVIGWRVDGRVDVFHDPALRLDPATYGITGEGLHAMAERSFSGALFELGPDGVQVDIVFRDLQGRPVHLVVRETDTRPRTPFGLLAPMGVAASEPPSLPLVYVDGFYFVWRAGTEYRIEIDGRTHRNDFIPLILDGTPVYFLRYSANPFIVTWNPDPEARLRVLNPRPAGAAGILTAHAEGVQYNIEESGPFREIRQMSRQEGNDKVVVEFNPALPQLLALADGVEINGAFRITAQPSLGAVRGSWRVARLGQELHLEIAPDGGWTPGPAPPMARVLFRVVSMFQDWPTTYLWRGTIQLPTPNQSQEEAVLLSSGWERIAQ